MDIKSLAYSDDLSLYALSKNTKLSKVLVAVTGHWEGHQAGAFSMNTEIMQEMIDNFKEQKVDTVCDYEHQTLTGSIAPASGWIKDVTLENEKLYAHVEWTDKALEQIKNKEYKYVSPVFQRRTIKGTTGNNIGWTLHSLSLTNRPFLEELGEVIANKNNNLIYLQKQNEDLIANNKALEEQVKSLTNEKIELFINKAIEDKKLRKEQRDFALKLAYQDFEDFQEFINNNRHFIIPPSDIYANSKVSIVSQKNSSKNDVDYMIDIASKQSL